MTCTTTGGATDPGGQRGNSDWVLLAVFLAALGFAAFLAILGGRRSSSGAEGECHLELWQLRVVSSDPAMPVMCVAGLIALVAVWRCFGVIKARQQDAPTVVSLLRALGRKRSDMAAC